MRKIFAILLLVSPVFALAHNFSTTDFDAHFTPLWGEDATEFARRLTKITVAIDLDDISRPHQLLKFNGQNVEYLASDYFILAIKAHFGTSILASSDISLPKSALPLKDGMDIVVPQGMAGGFVHMNYKNGFLFVRRAEDPSLAGKFFNFKSQDDFRIEISPDLAELISINWEGYSLKMMEFGFKKKEITTNIFARFVAAKIVDGK